MAKMTYAESGVDYKTVDGFKRAAQKAAAATDKYIEDLGIRVVSESRGESAFLLEFPDHYFAHVEEGLGTKNLVADASATEGRGFHTQLYNSIAKDTVAMMLNDLATLGARPLSVAMHLAVGASGWFEDEARNKDLIQGWQLACRVAKCTWGGGETPVLKGIVHPTSALLSGSAVGIIRPKSRMISPERIRAGDIIVIVKSSGVHANGLTLCRSIAEKLPEGFRTPMPTGEEYGMALLPPTIIYSPLVEACLDAGVDIHYAVHITGHGWAKLMRAPQPFRYIIDTLPRQQPIFDFIQEHGPVEEREMYKTFNVGAGFALYVPEGDVAKVREVAGKLAGDMALLHNPLHVFQAGRVETCGHREVYIKPKNIVFDEKDLDIR